MDDKANSVSYRQADYFALISYNNSSFIVHVFLQLIEQHIRVRKNLANHYIHVVTANHVEQDQTRLIRFRSLMRHLHQNVSFVP